MGPFFIRFVNKATDSSQIVQKKKFDKRTNDQSGGWAGFPGLVTFGR
jgi:hypothetical protein